jgi:hypothetical protein
VLIMPSSYISLPVTFGTTENFRHRERHLRRRGGQHPVQRHSRQTSSVPVYGGGPLWVPGAKDVIPQWCPQDLGRS